jgi:Lon protease-like protein
MSFQFSLFLLIISVQFLSHFCSAWFLSSPSPSFSSLFPRQQIISGRIPNSALRYSKEDKEKTDEDEESEKRRMEAVRSLQVAFYQANTTSSSLDTTTTTTTINESPQIAMTRLEAATGQLINLPLWRAPWWEVPGRSNVLNVHDPIYTNMFEQIIRGPKPWCFGHLYLEGGSKNLKSNGLPTLETYGKKKTIGNSAVVGCLLHIQDYRRFANGRLLLLVHVLERFVVTYVHQELPYSIVNAKIVPDAEELDPNFSSVDASLLLQLPEADVTLARGLAVQESVRYHDYEYNPDHALTGVSNETYLELTDILWSAIARVLPYCPYSKNLDPPLPTNGAFYLPDAVVAAAAADHDTGDTEKAEEPSFESQLLQKGIFQTPLFDPEYDSKYLHLTVDELEYELWMAINRFLLATKTPVSPVILGLLPRSNATTTKMLEDGSLIEQEVWPCDFSIYPIVQDFENASLNPPYQNYTHDFVRVSPEYPAHRRQRRLSYSALHLLEKTSEVTNQLRPLLLKTPSTRQRLRLVLEKFDQWQEEHWGEFQ